MKFLFDEYNIELQFIHSSKFIIYWLAKANVMAHASQKLRNVLPAADEIITEISQTFLQLLIYFANSFSRPYPSGVLQYKHVYSGRLFL